ncbi:hypothetical protein BDP27DRAFT_517723 [Rhodocollybia butyracea]|uniref:Uncharacterized protein n=1 Tax=Rhodocollybia butyracea TaxID=206335 RepID=A0A9P5U8X4_9AGAR|nr:hypothetical protein BDP27DRAFT_517723 [Rhodocollybia butyracea]
MTTCFISTCSATGTTRLQLANMLISAAAAAVQPWPGIIHPTLSPHSAPQGFLGRRLDTAILFPHTEHARSSCHQRYPRYTTPTTLSYVSHHPIASPSMHSSLFQTRFGPNCSPNTPRARGFRLSCMSRREKECVPDVHEYMASWEEYLPRA